MNKLKSSLLIAGGIFLFSSDCWSQDIHSNAPVVLPQITGQTYIVPANYTRVITSKQSITLGPGTHFQSGSTVTVKIDNAVTLPIALNNPSEDLNRNWTIIQTFDEDGNEIGAVKNFYDDNGKSTQVQVKSLSTNHVLASQTLYDIEGRVAINTLQAPTNNSAFRYKDDFVTRIGGGTYQIVDYDADYINYPYLPRAVRDAPRPIDKSQMGTLGWYYSNNNSFESQVAEVAYPFSRTHYSLDGTQRVEKEATVGDELKTGSGHEVKMKILPVNKELDHYIQIRNKFFSADVIGEKPVSMAGKAIQNISKDPNGLCTVQITDLGGKPLMSGMGNTNGWLNIADPAVTDPMPLSYNQTLSDISYSFYNQLGQLIASVAPNGVKELIDHPDNYSATGPMPFSMRYEYDLQGRLIATTQTDAGRSEFVYRKDGKIRFSQNAEQHKAPNGGRFSYTNYDDVGRPTESGEYVPQSSGDIQFAATQANETLLESTALDGGLTGGQRQDWVKTHYDLPDNSHGLSAYVQDEGFLRGAVSWTESPNSKTWYNYDGQGRVDWMVKQLAGLGTKTLHYAYDAKGNVTKVDFQQGNSSERFLHHYTYDADGRLTNVETSRNDVNKLQHAKYYYALHGPLKRVELGDQLQGIDYTYTAQGWLKSINHPSGTPANDPGLDGASNGFSPDAFGLQLEYFANDYARTGSTIAPVATGQASYYNGNVSGLSWYSKKPQSVVSTDGPAIQAPSMYTYTYDPKYQLNSSTWGVPNFNDKNFTPENRFKEQNLSYDPNGNIKTLQRTNATGALSDNFDNYQYQPGTNKLQSVGSTAVPNSYASYSYDDLGQLKSAQQAGVPFGMYLKYDVSGKITGIYANEALTDLKVGYTYDEAGNRITRTDYTSGTPQTAYYVYDPSGNVLAIYNGTTISEAPVYGADRLGTYTYASNSYVYEMRDNVGSVRVVISRNKKADGTVDVLTYNDYYPFGNIARNGGVGYRYEYQGAYAEKDPVTGYNNFDLRMYDSRIGRWLSVDPKGQYASPYVGLGNNTVNSVDPDGGESSTSPIIDKDTGMLLGYDSWGTYGAALYTTAEDYNVYSNNGGITIDHEVASRAFDQAGDFMAFDWSRGDYLQFDASFVNATRTQGTLTWYNSKRKESGVYAAISGSGRPKYYPIPEGKWNATFVNTEPKEKFTRAGVSFRVTLGPDRYDPLRGRETGLIRIHPARSLGTEGCIGLISDKPTVLKDFQDRIVNYIHKHKSIPVYVNYK